MGVVSASVCLRLGEVGIIVCRVGARPRACVRECVNVSHTQHSSIDPPSSPRHNTHPLVVLLFEPQCQSNTALLSRRPSPHMACPSMACAPMPRSSSSSSSSTTSRCVLLLLLLLRDLCVCLGVSSSGKETTAGVPPPRSSARMTAKHSPSPTHYAM